MTVGLHRCLALALLAAVTTGAHAQTKMFKCVVDGRTIYQQTACAVQPAADEAKAAAAAASAPRPGDARAPARPAQRTAAAKGTEPAAPLKPLAEAPPSGESARR
jgi:hypothetical protein